MTEGVATPLHDELLISEESLSSDDSYDVIMSNISVVNALKEEFFRDSEQAPDAMRSYWVDYYLAEVKNGGFSQFVYNTRWNAEGVAFVQQGMEAMGATEHLALFRKAAAEIGKLGEEGLQRFFDSEYFGDNVDRDFLSSVDDQIFDCDERENLVELNAQWLKSQPALRSVPREALRDEIKRLSSLIDDREKREAEALEAEPRYMKLIRALCEKAGHEFRSVTAGTPIPRKRRVWGLFTRHYNVVAWHFHTDQGLHYMVDDAGKAEMYGKKTDELVTSLTATDEYGPN